MERISRLIRIVPAAAATAVLLVALSTCSNPINFIAEVKDSVMVANDLYLEVVYVSPPKNEPNANTYGSILIEFDRAIDPDTVTPSTVVISPAVTWANDPNYDPLTRTVSILPSILDSVTAYTVNVTEGVKGTDGSSLRDPYAWSFTTKQGPGGTVTIVSTAASQNYTGSASVNLTITSNFVTTHYRVSPNDPPTFDPGNMDWLTISPSGSTTLPAGDGEKKVYIQFRDGSSNVTPEEAIFDTIVLDTTDPTANSLAVAGGNPYTNSTSVSLTTAASDTGSYVYQMQFSNNGSTWSSWEAWNTTKTGWVLGSGDGTKTVWFRVKDVAGNISSSRTDTIILDQTIPVVTSFTVGNGDPSYTLSPTVTLYITATDSSGLSQSRYGNYFKPWSSWESYATTKSWTLEDKAGTRRAYVQVKDNAGNVSTLNADWDEILLYARIGVTYTQMYISDDSDLDLKIANKGEIYYYFYIDGSLKLYRTQANYYSVASPGWITSANLPQTTYTIYEHPSSGSFTMTGYVYDDDGDIDDYGTMSSITYNAPFSDVSSAARSFSGDVDGYIYYSIDFVNP